MKKTVLLLLLLLLLVSLNLLSAEIVNFIFVVDDPTIEFESVEYYSSLTNGYISFGYLDNAERDINEGLIKYPSNIDLILMKGKVYFEKGQIKEELQFYTDELINHPNEAKLYFARSYCHHDLNNDEEYINDLLNTVKYDNTHAMAYGNLGLYYLNKKDFDNADKYLIESVKYDPDQTAAFNNLASSKYQTGQFKKAVEYCDLSLLNDTENVLAFYLRGLSQKQLGNDELGDDDINKAKVLNQKNNS